MAALSLPTIPSLEQMRKQARDLQRAVRAGDATATERVATLDPAGQPHEAATCRLNAAQLVVARSYGFPSWPRLVHYFDVVATYGRPGSAASSNEAMVEALIDAGDRRPELDGPAGLVAALLDLGADPTRRPLRRDTPGLGRACPSGRVRGVRVQVRTGPSLVDDGPDRRLRVKRGRIAVDLRI